MRDINLFGKIKEGKLEILNKETYIQWVKQCKEGEDIVIKLRNQKDYWSTRQLRLIYAEFRQISQHMGHSLLDVKTMMKMYNGYCWTHELDGKDITECKSISQFNRKELTIFIEQIDRWAWDNLGIKLLNSDDISFLEDSK